MTTLPFKLGASTNVKVIDVESKTSNKQKNLKAFVGNLGGEIMLD
jgi:hypothetical protein